MFINFFADVQYGIVISYKNASLCIFELYVCTSESLEIPSRRITYHALCIYIYSAGVVNFVISEGSSYYTHTHLHDQISFLVRHQGNMLGTN